MAIYRRARTNLIHYYFCKGTLNHIPYESPRFYYIASDLDARAKCWNHARLFESHMKNQTQIAKNTYGVCARAVKGMKDTELNDINDNKDGLNHEELDDIYQLNFAEFETG